MKCSNTSIKTDSRFSHMDDIRAFSDMRKDRTAKELIEIVYNEAIKRCANDEAEPQGDWY